MEDIATLLKLVNPDLPLFIYGHSMGGLSVTSFLTNNPNLNISGAILSAPLLRPSKDSGVDEFKKLMVDLLKPQLDNIVLNTMIPVHQVSSDRRFYHDLLLNRKFIPFISLGLT